MTESEGLDINNNDLNQSIEETQEVSSAPRFDAYAFREGEEKVTQKKTEPRTVSEFYREMGEISEEYLDSIFSLQEDLQEMQEVWVNEKDLVEEYDLLAERYLKSTKAFNRIWNSLLKTSERTYLIHQRMLELRATQGLPSDLEKRGRDAQKSANRNLSRNFKAEEALRHEYAGGERNFAEKTDKLIDTIVPIYKPRMRAGFRPVDPSIREGGLLPITYADKVAEQDFRRATNPRRMEELAKANELNPPTSRFIDEFKSLSKEEQEDLRAYARKMAQEREEREERAKEVW